MGTINDSGQLAAFQSDPYAVGLDLGRCEIHRDLGTFKAASSTSFRAGQIVALNASNEIVVCGGADALGIAKWNKVSLGQSVVVDEAVVLTGTTASNLAHAPIVGASVRVHSATGFGGTQYTVTTDYTVNATNGTVTRNGAGAIASGATVYVTYAWALTNADYEFQGRNFFNFVDDVTVAESRIAVIQAPGKIFTTEWAQNTDTAYALTGAGSLLRCDANGQLSNDSGLSTPVLGKVIQLPDSTSAFMGCELFLLPA